MTFVGQPERVTQNRVAALFREELGYAHLGDWPERPNSNIEEGYLSAWLRRRGYTGMQITRAIHRLRTEADDGGRTLYGTIRRSTAYWATARPSPRRRGSYMRRST